MEEKRLNLDAPLMSMRRYVSSYDDNGKKLETSMVNRQLTLSYYSSDLGSETVTGQITVPFVWEQTPGRPKVKKGFESQVPVEEAHVILRLPPGRISDIVNDKSLNDRMEVDRNEKGGSDMEEDDDAVYSDALDTLSPTNSSSVSCSVSGFSGCNDLSTVVNPLRTFSTDPQTRDYMIKRFLPASKAVSLDPPSYASKKQVVVMEPEQPNERRSVVSVVDRKDEESESESEADDEYDDIANMSKKGCGLLPHMGFKNSLLNQVSGLKVRTRNSMNSFGKPSIAAHIESHLQTVKKHVRDSFTKRKTDRGFKSSNLLTNESNLNRGKNRVVYNSLDQLTTSSSSSSSRYPGGISPYRNTASRSPIREVGFLGTPKNAVCYSFKEGTHQLLIPSRSSGPVYANTLSFRETSSSDSSSSRTVSWMGTMGEAFGASSGIRVIEESDGSVESAIQHIKGLTVAQGPVRDVDQQYNSLECIKFTGDENLDTSTDWRFLLSPPSESWLSRTMPTHVTSSGNAFSKPSVSTQYYPRTHDLKSPSSVSNWETIVKTS